MYTIEEFKVQKRRSLAASTHFVALKMETVCLLRLYLQLVLQSSIDLEKTTPNVTFSAALKGR